MTNEKKTNYVYGAEQIQVLQKLLNSWTERQLWINTFANKQASLTRDDHWLYKNSLHVSKNVESLQSSIEKPANRHTRL